MVEPSGGYTEESDVIGQQTGPVSESGHRWKAALHTSVYVWAEHTGGRKRPVKFGRGEPELQGRRCHTESTAPSSDQGDDGITVLFCKTSLRAMEKRYQKF